MGYLNVTWPRASINVHPGCKTSLASTLSLEITKTIAQLMNGNTLPAHLPPGKWRIEMPRLRASFHQTFRACQWPGFTFSPWMASKNASRTVGNHSIFSKPCSSKPEPWVKPAASSSLLLCIRAPKKTLLEIQSPLGIYQVAVGWGV